MQTLLFVFALLVCGFAPATARAQTERTLADLPAAEAAKVFDLWFGQFRGGTVDLGSFDDRRSKSVLHQRKLLPNDVRGRLTAQLELSLLLDRLIADGTPDAALRILRAGGFAQTPSPRHARNGAHVLAAMCVDALTRFESVAAQDLMLRAASSSLDDDSDRTWHEGMRCQALRALGRRRHPVVRPLLVQALAATQPHVRAAAADGLRPCRHAGAAVALADALATEADAAAAMAQLAALDEILRGLADTADPSLIRRSVSAALSRLGQIDWRADLQIVPFLVQHRSSDAVPALVAILERTGKDECPPPLVDQVRSALESLTGAWHAPTERAGLAKAWRTFWEAEQTRFVVAPAKKVEEGRTAAATFFGIPATGMRVVFVLDVSGSMSAPLTLDDAPTTSAGNGARDSRLEVAKRELLGCVARMPDSTLFHVVTFSSDVRTWCDGLVPANPTNRRKLNDWIERLHPGGGTNLWGGLSDAMKLRVAAPGDRYAGAVDEIFVLSDGMPSAGEVVDPVEIQRLVAESVRANPIRIHTIFLGRTAKPTGSPGAARFLDASGEGLMQGLAAIAGGRCVVR